MILELRPVGPPIVLYEEDDMESRLYCIRDRVAEDSGPIFQAVNDAVAARSYRAFMAQNQVEEDEYSLLCIGTFDSGTSKLDAFEVPLNVEVPAAKPKQLRLEGGNDGR